MPGPDPALNRRRRNPPTKTSGQVLLARSGRKGRPPAMAATAAVSDTVEGLWREWWSSPMATAWTRTDTHLLTRLALLYDLFLAPVEGADPAKVSAEMRQLEHALGLTPKGRKDLGWVIVDDDQTSGETGDHRSADRRPTAGARRGRRDPRLTVLPGGVDTATADGAD